jgi:hypothetical protein
MPEKIWYNIATLQSNWVEMRDMKAGCFAIPRVKQNKDILFLYEVVWKDLLLTSTGIPN